MDISLIATPRPDVHTQLIESWRPFLGDLDQHRLVVNIEPVCDGAVETVANLARYFRQLHVNVPLKPCFPRAVRWCWRNIHGRYFLHLTDNWVLENQDVRHEELTLIMRHCPALCCLRLASGAATEIECLSARAKGHGPWAWNGYFYEPPRGTAKMYYGQPAVMKPIWARKVWARLDEVTCPELQIQRLRDIPIVRKAWYGIWSRPGLPRLIRHIDEAK